MVNLKKYNDVFKLFVISLTFICLGSCGANGYYVSKIETKKIGITSQKNENSSYETYLKPYREHIDADLNSILAYCPETLDKSNGKWQTPIGNLLADVSLSRGNTVFFSREKKNIDLCILNSGGIRSILPKGNVTARTAFEIMPFENSLVVVALDAQQIIELCTYFIASQKAHPIAGMNFTIDKNNSPKNIVIQGKPIASEKLYYVVTNDYLANGGDNMLFFVKAKERFDLNYKIRNVLIDYFKEIDTIPVPKDIRITQE